MDTAWIDAWMESVGIADPGPAWLALLIACGTLLSEDLACIAAGVLIAEGRLPIGFAVLGCGGGVILGDAALYGLGRCVRSGAIRAGWLRSRLSEPGRLEEIRRRLAERGDAFLFTSRFLPGIRFPVYVLAGMLGWPFGRFMRVLILAALLWTPALVTAAALLGRAALEHLQGVALWITVPVFLLATLHLARAAGARADDPLR